MNIHLYDHTARRVSTLPVPVTNLNTFGYTEREIAVLRPLVASMIEVVKIERRNVAVGILESLTWGLCRRMATEGHVHDMRISIEGFQDFLTPPDPERHALFVKFLYDYKGQRLEGRFIIATRPFDTPDCKSVQKL